MDIFGAEFPDVTYIMPQLILAIFALLVPAVYFASKSDKLVSLVSLVGITGSLASIVYLWDQNEFGVFEGLFRFDEFSALFMGVFLIVAFYVVLASSRAVENDHNHGEYYSLIMIATVGMMFVASSLDLIALFVALEATSISSFALVAYRKGDKRGSEAATKYFIIGGMSSALTLFGISLLYGATGSTTFDGINAALSAGVEFDSITYLALAMLIAGFGFKISAVPFHAWAPDVYEGAPTPITAMLAAGSKKMGFVAVFKVFLIGLIAIKADWELMMGILAVVTMTLGNVVALQQTNIKRMLAYSSIAQAGYILLVLPIGTEYALAGGIFHIITHAFMKGGAFMIVAALAYSALGESISDSKGLAKRSPFLAFSMMLLLFSLAGIPPLGGFASKVVLFSSAIEAASEAQWLVWLAVAAIINSAISLYYYVRVIKYMYVEDGTTDERIKTPAAFMIVVLLCVLAIVFIGLFPETTFSLCEEAARAFFANL